MREQTKYAKGGEIRMVKEFDKKDGIQISSVKTEDGKIGYTASVIHYPLYKFVPFVPNRSKKDVIKRAKEIEKEMLDYKKEKKMAKGGKTQNEYIVEVLIDEEIDLGTNVFANSEDEAMDKAEELIRERNSKYEDSIIDIVDVVKINAKGGIISAPYLQMSNLDKQGAEQSVQIFEKYNKVVKIKKKG